MMLSTRLFNGVVGRTNKIGLTSSPSSYLQNKYFTSIRSTTIISPSSRLNNTTSNNSLYCNSNNNKINSNTFETKNIQYLKRIYSTINSTNVNATTTIIEDAETNTTIPPPITPTTPPTPTKSKGFMRGPYMTLIKLPITIYVTLTAIAGYVAACPIGSFDWITLGQVSVGTFLASCSANIHNQEMEVQHDRRMPRTKDRPLVVGTINRGKAWAGSMALLTLGFGVMAVTPALFVPGTLAACNVILYCWYTDLKRVTPLNTWVGAIVGAIPPLIGSVAATGQFESIGMLMASFLYIWQIPHFLALSQVLREQYRGAGYKMLSVTHSKQVVDRVSVAHALFGIPMPFIFDYFFNFNVHPITLTAMALGSVSLALPFFTKVTPKRLYIISLIALPITLFLSCILRQPYTYYTDDDEKEKEKKTN